ncbi:protein CNPPD1 isoform X2 [Drosophila teissieri]|uniref:protein CNPPD1 isoform X2 n=1 Tax=Drosophila teissieri TaxID=7243 RepID=UPI001CBA0044|nr:protein CNPPD1 isoform X2 [Drosophila teissieri]
MVLCFQMDCYKLFASPRKVMKYEDFIRRIRKSLYYGYETPDTDMSVSLPFAEYAADLFSETHRGHSLHRLSCASAAQVHATPCSLIMALIYLDRLNVVDSGYSCRITPQELFVVSLMISTKFYAGHDERFYLEDWASEASMTEDRLKTVELEFLSAMGWNIYISNELFFDKLKNVERTLAEQQGLRRGWLTYSELVHLLPSIGWMKFLVNSLSVLTLSYAASIITVAGAFFIASHVPGTLWHREMETTSSKLTKMTISSQESVPNAIETTPFMNIEVYSVLRETSEVKVELMNFEEPSCAKARLNKIKYKYPRYQSVPTLSFISTSPKLDLLHAQDGARNWHNIKTPYNDYKNNRNLSITVRVLQLEKHNAENVSVIWQINTEAMQ